MLLVLIPHFRDRSAVDRALINPLVALWNLGLSLFSMVGLAFTLPRVVHVLATDGFRATVCYNAQWYGHGYCGLFVMLFIYSKLLELFDTLWLILKKRPVIFLHSYHHITVLLYCWHSYSSRIASGIWFATMNYAVHSLMYFYYFLMTLDSTRKAAKPFNWVLTTLQTSQMVVGIYVTLKSMAFGDADGGAEPCNVSRTNSLLGLLMYASYFLLFLHFAVQSYVLAPRRAEAQTPAKGGGGKRQTRGKKAD
jgi:elongation of very long chain fatty acids protein 6